MSPPPACPPRRPGPQHQPAVPPPERALGTPLPPSPPPRPVPSSPVPMVPPAKETPGSAGGMVRPGGGTASRPPARGDWLPPRDRRGHRARELSIRSGQGWLCNCGGGRALCIPRYTGTALGGSGVARPPVGLRGARYVVPRPEGVIPEHPGGTRGKLRHGRGVGGFRVPPPPPPPPITPMMRAGVPPCPPPWGASRPPRGWP